MNRLAKFLIILVALGGLAWLFVRSAASTRAEPYTVQGARLQGWTVAVQAATLPAPVLLAVQGPRELGANLFRQLFSRAAESFNGPTVPFVPLVLHDEFTRSFRGQVSVEELTARARDAGLESSPFTPRCMAYRRESAPGVTRQLYFVLYDAPAFEAFRAGLAPLAAAGSGYDPAALSPAMIVAATDPEFGRWLPLRVEPNECVAPISVE